MTDLMQSQLFIDELRALGVKPPPDALLALDIHSTALRAATATPTEDLRRDLLAGQVSAADVAARVLEAAARATAKEKAFEIVKELAFPLRQRIREAVTADAERIVRELRKPFDKAAKTMHAAGSLFPAHATEAEILRRGPEAATAWQQLEQARMVLDKCAAIRRALAREYRYGSPTPVSLMFVTGIDSEHGFSTAEQAYSSTGNNLGGRWHQLTTAGFTLHLNTATEQDAVLTAVQQAIQTAHDTERAQRVALQQQESEKFLRRFGVSGPSAA